MIDTGMIPNAPPRLFPLSPIRKIKQISDKTIKCPAVMLAKRRMAREIGFTTLLRYLIGQLTLAETLTRISEKAGCSVAHVEILAPRAAVDVDSVADHALAEQILSAC